MNSEEMAIRLGILERQVETLNKITDALHQKTILMDERTEYLKSLIDIYKDFTRTLMQERNERLHG